MHISKLRCFENPSPIRLWQPAESRVIPGTSSAVCDEEVFFSIQDFPALARQCPGAGVREGHARRGSLLKPRLSRGALTLNNRQGSGQIASILEAADTESKKLVIGDKVEVAIVCVQVRVVGG